MFSLDYDRESAGDEDGSPKMQLPVLAKSPRRPSNAPKYEEEEVIKLKRMTAEEKQMVKTLIKLTTRKVPPSILFTSPSPPRSFS